MDHQLEDTLNLERSIGVEFEHTGDVDDGQAGVSSDGGGQMEVMPMEFENIEEQPMLMETANEETIGLMGEEFTLTEEPQYSSRNEKISQINTIQSDQSNILAPETIMDLQFEPETLTTSTPSSSAPVQKIAIRAQTQPTPRAVATAPRQIAIAPKPTPGVKQTIFSAGKQYTITPKTVGLASLPRAGGVVKKVTLSGVMQGQKSGQTVIAQIGKQLVMMPAGSGQKIKLVQSDGQQIQAQLISAKNLASVQGAKKPILAKVMVQSQSKNDPEQSAVLTKLTPGGAGAPRYVTMQQKTVPISKVIMGSPTNSGMRFTKPKQHIVSVQSSPSKQITTQKVVPQKVVIANSAKNIVLKSTIPHKATQIVKADGNVVNVSGQRGQLQQSNGVQYIRLVTNPTTGAPTKVAGSVVKQQLLSMPPKTILLTDNKGNIIQMSSDKITQPPPIVVTSSTSVTKVTVKTQQKLVRIAPVMPKTSQANTTMPRAGQSLLAQITPTEEPQEERQSQPEDSKTALRALIENAVADDSPDADVAGDSVGMSEVEVGFEKHKSPVQQTTKEHLVECKVEEHPLIVIPSYDQEQTYDQEKDISNDNVQEQSYIMDDFLNGSQNLSGYQLPSPPLNTNDLERPRKACNCTKSQCLKLYCDCFANGEFCNRCNCTNCHNNLENEELRQKAIRGCLDRNPNAFRPKIGKSRSDGPENVRRHNKGCNCKRSGCLKNYCECYEAKIACTTMCKCVGCRNVEEALERLLRRRAGAERGARADSALCRPPPVHVHNIKQPCSFMTTEVIEAVCQCLLAAAAEGDHDPAQPPSPSPPPPPPPPPLDPVKGVIEEFARCLQDIISASHQGPGAEVPT